MAPTPGHRSSIRSGPTGRSSGPSVDARRESRSVFSTTKKDKRTIKRAALVSRIEKSNPSSKKRRRPSKKLVTTLESLAHALPSLSEDQNGETVIGDARIKHKSLKSRPGAMKKKETLIRMERERFNKNMSQMMQSNTSNNEGKSRSISSHASDGIGKRWAAIRGFIQQTMEQRSECRAEPRTE